MEPVLTMALILSTFDLSVFSASKMTSPKRTNMPRKSRWGDIYEDVFSDEPLMKKGNKKKGQAWANLDF